MPPSVVAVGIVIAVLLLRFVIFAFLAMREED